MLAVKVMPCAARKSRNCLSFSLAASSASDLIKDWYSGSSCSEGDAQVAGIAARRAGIVVTGADTSTG